MCTYELLYIIIWSPGSEISMHQLVPIWLGQFWVGTHWLKDSWTVIITLTTQIILLYLVHYYRINLHSEQKKLDFCIYQSEGSFVWMRFFRNWKSMVMLQQDMMDLSSKINNKKNGGLLYKWYLFWSFHFHHATSMKWQWDHAMHWRFLFVL